MEIKYQMNKKRVKLQSKVAIYFVVVTLVLCVGVSFVISQYYLSKMKEFYSKRAVQQGYIMSEYMDSNVVQEAIDGKLSKEKYTEIENYLKRVLKECELKYLYVFVPRENDVIYIWDLTSVYPDILEEECAYISEEDKAVCNKLKNGYYPKIETVVSNSAEFGYIVTAYVPLLDDNGDLVAILGLDMSMDLILQNVREFRIVVIGIVLLIMFIYAQFAYFSLKMKILNPIIDLIREMSQFVQTDDTETEEIIDIIFGNDEIDDLTIGFNYMIESLKKNLEDLENANKEIKEKSAYMYHIQNNIIIGMATMIEGRDGSTGEHVINTARYVEILARELLKRGMYPETITYSFVERLIKAAPMHDIGKVAIPDSILNKPGRFTDDEYTIMKTHSAEGGKLLLKVLGDLTDQEFINIAEDVTLYHHEKWDGTGYPSGLKGTEIPLAARIMAVADVYDALIAVRVYKNPMPREKALKIIEEEAGTHFDPELALLFVELMR